MGGLRRVKKQLAGKQIMIVDTGLVFNGCKVLLAVGNTEETASARKFVGFMDFLMFRASQVNMGDLIAGQREMLARMADGRSLLN